MNLTSDDLAEAARACDGVCLLPFGVLERHGPHLPLGTDQIAVDEVARRAAEIEPAVVFPGYYFGKIFTARHQPGTVALTRRLLMPLLEAVCDEIARNGFSKILIVNGHGGNTSLLHVFLRSLLEEPRDYAVYASDWYELDDATRQKWHEVRASDFGGHADEMETSVMLVVRPDAVHMDRVPADPKAGRPTGRLAHLEGLDTTVGWYGEYPDHYAGDARGATVEKGEFLLKACVERLARQIRLVKEDEAVLDLQQEFYRRAEGHRA